MLRLGIGGGGLVFRVYVGVAFRLEINVLQQNNFKEQPTRNRHTHKSHMCVQVRYSGVIGVSVQGLIRSSTHTRNTIIAETLQRKHEGEQEHTIITFRLGVKGWGFIVQGLLKSSTHISNTFLVEHFKETKKREREREREKHKYREHAYMVVSQTPVQHIVS